MNVTDYTRQIKQKLRLERTLDAAGQRKTHVLEAMTTIQTCPIKLSDGAIVDLFIDGSNLYLHGYGARGKVFVTDDHPVPAMNGIRLGYKSNYGDLGWDRSTTPERIFTQASLDAALASAALGKALTRDQFIALVILMEITRFPSLAKKVSRGEAIKNSELDWEWQHRFKNTEIITAKMDKNAA